MATESEITFAIPGRELPTQQLAEGEQRTVLAGVTREAGAVVRLATTEGSFVKIELVNGPELILHPETAKALFDAQEAATGTQRGESSASQGAVVVPAQLAWPAPASVERGKGSAEGGVALRAFSIVKETVGSQGANLVGKALGQWFDEQTKEALRPLNPRNLADLAYPRPTQPAENGHLVLIHGTFSTTVGSFGKLWSEHADHVRDLFRYFADHVYGFDHPTLTQSPIANALSLVQRLAESVPDGAKLHLLTHSRGGLVAEVLARAASNQPLTERELDLFKEKNSEDVPLLEELFELVAARSFTVVRVVRVACPTRGTLLASERLDAYLSVLKWGLQLASIPVAPQLVGFLLALAKRREDVRDFSGLEAMTPQSALVRWLHDSDEPIAGDVRIIAGDVQGDSVTSWVKTLLADSFFWTDNDLVVQTRSMYGGAPRRGGALFLLDRSGKANHFSYFSNALTADGVRSALIADRPRGFAPLGPLSAAGLDSSGARGSSSSSPVPSDPRRPAVVVLPGIMGSHLSVGNQRVWLSYRMFNGLSRLEYGKEAGVVTAEQPLGTYYDDLIAYLSKEHHVEPFPFDWRAPIEDEAARLGPLLERLLREREGTNQPVHVVAHSMGGLVVRSVELMLPGVWQKLMAQPEGRVLMLGTPNAGAWAPMQVLSGDHLLGGAITAVGALFDDQRARSIFAGLPGFLQLQADLESYAAQETWERLSKLDEAITLKLLWHALPIQKASNSWGIPPKAVLDRALWLRQRLDQQATRLKEHRRNIRIVVGSAPRTIVGVEERDKDVSYVDGEGDGTVPLTSGLLDGVPAFQADAAHAELPRCQPLFQAYVELLRRGTTPLLKAAPSYEDAHSSALLKRRLAAAVSRGASKANVDATPSDAAGRSRGFAPETPTDLVTDVFSLGNGLESTAGASVPALEIVVTNGDLTLIRLPLMLGHYDSPKLTGAEWAMNAVIGKAMSRALELDDYPQELRSNKIFINTYRLPNTPWSPPRPQAVVVVGMGQEGELRSQQLAATITRAVVAYAQQLGVCCLDASTAPKTESRAAAAQALSPASATSFELASTLLGSGGMGMTVATAALSLAEGVRNANAKLFKLNLPIVSKLHVVELYEDRATDALRSLIAAAERLPQAFRVNPALDFGMQPLPRSPDASYRGANYDLISAVGGRANADEPTIEFTIDTKRARTESRSTTKSVNLLQAIIANAEAAGRSTTDFGETLFKLLVPPEMDDFFGNSEAVLLEVDGETAGIPWEVLSSERNAQQKPWAIRTKLLRKRKSTNYRARPVAAGQDASALVIGQPKCDDPNYPPLRGAVKEAHAVAKVLGTQAFIDKDAATLVGALLGGPYRIVHVAGHGREDGKGVILSDKTVLDSDLIQRIRRVPDLVFINCCHSAREGITSEVTAEQRALERDRPRLASNIAKGLIEIGVRCVIATGWAVNDDAAEEFARVFYEALLRGECFQDAVAFARDQVWADFKNSNTWAAYQCYGDPDWRLVGADDGRSADTDPPIPSPRELIITLKATAHRGLGSQDAALRALEKLDKLASQYKPRWGKRGDVAEAFAIAYSDLGELPKSIEWYDVCLEDERGAATQRAIEQLLNLRSRVAATAVGDVFLREHRRDELLEAAQAARKTIHPARMALEKLVEVRKTYERFSLLGSASKRLATVALWVEREQPGLGIEEARQEVAKLIGFYADADELGEKNKVANKYYALLNRLSGELVRDLLNGVAPQPVAEQLLEDVAKTIKEDAQDNPSFFSLVQIQELDILRAMRAQNLSSALEEIRPELEALHERLRSPREWASVRDQARFQLLAYALYASGAEVDAAEELLALLEGYAHG